MEGENQKEENISRKNGRLRYMRDRETGRQKERIR
jgi:hypothetical protein